MLNVSNKRSNLFFKLYFHIFKNNPVIFTCHTNKTTAQLLPGATALANSSPVSFSVGFSKPVNTKIWLRHEISPLLWLLPRRASKTFEFLDTYHNKELGLKNFTSPYFSSVKICLTSCLSCFFRSYIGAVPFLNLLLMKMFWHDLIFWKNISVSSVRNVLKKCLTELENFILFKFSIKSWT